LIRRIVERISRDRVLRRTLPEAFGSTPIYVSPDSQLSYLRAGPGAWDSELLRIAQEQIKIDSLVWDIGANIGVFAFAAASIATQGHVLAVEPDVWLASIMRRSASLKQNANLNIDILPAAISDRSGVATFATAKRGRASSYLEDAGGRSQTGGIRDRTTVPTLTLDSLLTSQPPPGFLKIDVEGAELAVLQGALGVLRNARPVIYVEVGADHKTAIADILSDNDYKMYDGSQAVIERHAIDICAYNTLAIPREAAQ